MVKHLDLYIEDTCQECPCCDDASYDTSVNYKYYCHHPSLSYDDANLIGVVTCKADWPPIPSWCPCKDVTT